MKARSLLVSVIVSSIFLIYPLAHSASYIIELNNGREVVTSRFWEEGDEIRFYSAAGIAGVQKDFVKVIKEVVATSQARTAPTPEAPHPTGNTSAPPATIWGKAPNTETHRPPEETDFASYRPKKAALMEQLNGATTQHLEAIGAKNAEAKKRALEDMREVSRRLYQLEDELKEKNQGVLPAWWNE
jgi:hypothetical protein